MRVRNLVAGAIVTAFVLAGSSASASTITFSAQDDNVSHLGPFPNSTAMQTTFITAAQALGLTNTITFENLAVGNYTPLFPATGVTIAQTGPTLCGNGLCGISSIAGLAGIQGFNTTSGGSHWLGFPGGTATFTFTTPTYSFGGWFTGLQTFYTKPGDLAISFNDGAPQVLVLPVNVNGGAQYFGFTSTIALSSITISNLTNDAWGIDDVTYNSGPLPGGPGAPVPEPGTLVLLSSGLISLVAVHRRRSSARA